MSRPTPLELEAAIWAAMNGDPRYAETKRAIDKWMADAPKWAEREHPLLRRFAKKGTVDE